MSLLQNEDFVLYQLRTAYLSSIKDGVGERLINVNTAVLNNPAFRAAGWVPNAADIKRTYSPPIPTAITSEYFQAPRSAGLRAPEGFGDDDEEGGMVTGGGGSTDTVGPTVNTKRRRRKEQLDEDDSSDLSDESDDDGDAVNRPANQIKFTKMPLRTRAGSSPIPGSALRNNLSDASTLTANAEGPSVMITSPSKPPDSRLRRGSLGAIDAIKERARRDTVTSSEMSSENELEPVVFQRKKVNPHRAAKASHLLAQRIQEDEREGDEHIDGADVEDESDDESLSSEFSGTAGSESLLGEVEDPLDSSPPHDLAAIPPAITPFNTSPKKQRQPAIIPMLQALPPPRPISVVPPISTLTLALQAKEKKPSNPLQRFATLSAQGDPNPLYIKIYCPFAAKSSKPVELLLKKTDENGEKVTVSEAIGFALWKYQEDKTEPDLKEDQMNVNCWVLRMYEDGEVDDEFPPLTRNKALTDFASNNNRPMRPRTRDKPWDEFALVQATEREMMENEKTTPKYSREAAAAMVTQKDSAESSTTNSASLLAGAPVKPLPARAKSFRNPITGPSFAPTATRKDSSNLLDAPAAPTSHSASRTGAPKTVTIHHLDENFNSKDIPMQCTTDTYIAELFDQVCHDLHLDKGLFVLKVTGSTTVAPSDRTVEALGSRSDLDLIRRRFIGDALSFGLAGSPGSSSPNAPLIISTGGAPKKTKKGDRTAAAVSGPGLVHPLAQNSTNALFPTQSYYRRYAVTRKQPMSFASSTSRILALDNEYIHIMPGETHGNAAAGGPKALFEAQGKTTTVHFSSVVGCKVSRKHPRMFRVIVFKERETKRYDFEASSKDEASEIVREVRKGVERFQEGVL